VANDVPDSPAAELCRELVAKLSGGGQQQGVTNKRPKPTEQITDTDLLRESEIQSHGNMSIYQQSRSRNSSSIKEG
jgi:hypothetical protein